VRIFLLLTALLPAACASTGSSTPQDKQLSPFYDQREQKDQGKTTQVRPFYWRREGPEGTKVNILPPLIRYREDDVYRRLHIFPLVFYTARHSPQDERSWFFMLFPFIFLGSDDFLVVPFGGVTHGLLGIDELVAFSWPYIRARWFSGSEADPIVFTRHNIFFPFIAWGSDKQPGGRRTFRVAPFYGWSRGRGGFSNGFVMWPFYTWRRSPNSHAWMIFPFYGIDESPTQKRTTVMFPFYFHTLDYLTGATDLTVFPFYRRAKGADNVDVSRYWPVYSYARTRSTVSEYAAWPIWHRQMVNSDYQYSRFTWGGGIFYRGIERVRRRDLYHEKKTLVWPVGRWQKTSNGYREVAVPLIWPFDSPSIREEGEPWRPFVSIYHKQIRPNGDRDISALFGSIMTRRTERTSMVTLLYGLLGWDRGPDGRHLRLLFGLRFRVSKKP